MLAEASTEDLPALLRSLAGDTRAGVREAVAVARRRMRANERETARLHSLAALEESLREQGYSTVAGLDEVGRGSLAGPVTAGAVVLPPGLRIDGLDDSKRVLPEKRAEIAEVIKVRAVAWAIGHVSAEEIDRGGMTWAVREAMTRALSELNCTPDHCVVDGLGVGLAFPETAVVGGDGKVAAIAAASIIAKVTRDAIMVSHAETYPEYLFHQNKGYSTSDHILAISRHGLCPLHRRSFQPCGGTIPLF